MNLVLSLRWRWMPAVKINDAYGIQTRPSSYLLDEDGVILARHFGIITESQLTELLMNAFAEE